MTCYRELLVSFPIVVFFAIFSLFVNCIERVNVFDSHDDSSASSCSLTHSLIPFTLVLAHTVSWFPWIYQLAIPGLFSVMK